MILEITPFLPELTSVAIISLLAIISPGPDLAIVIRNSLVYSRKAGIYTTIGIVIGLSFHLSYTLLGIGILITSLPWLFWIVKIIACSYLLFIGGQAIMSKKKDYNLGNTHHASKDLTPITAVRSGLLINLLNPKVMLFFFSLFTVFVSPETPKSLLLLYGLVITIEAMIWFNIVSLFFSNPQIRHFFSNAFHWVDRITGIILILLGITILWVTVS